MAFFAPLKAEYLVSVLVIFHFFFVSPCFCARKLTSLFQPPTMALTYHNGALLEGHFPVSIIWYGNFSPAQKYIVADFLLSLDPHNPGNLSSSTEPSVSQWWKTIRTYLRKAGKREVQITLSNQLSDESCSMGKTLRKSEISKLARAAGSSKYGGLTLVLTAKDVAVEGFCLSNCGFHGSDTKKRSAFIWVGNSETQCPGQCAWPFHQPIYGPQTPPLIAPNGDVGLDGMVQNIASLLAGTVTNPFGNGYFLGPAEAPLEVASACTGIYGKGAYPGYAGDLLVDASTGASYNARGANSRKYLLPAMLDPSTSQCSTIV